MVEPAAGRCSSSEREARTFPEPGSGVSRGRGTPGGQAGCGGDRSAGVGVVLRTGFGAGRALESVGVFAGVSRSSGVAWTGELVGASQGSGGEAQVSVEQCSESDVQESVSPDVA